MTNMKVFVNNGDVHLPSYGSDFIDVNSSVAMLPLQEEGENETPLASTDTVTKPELLSRHIPSINSTLVIRQLSSQGLSFQLWPAATTLLTLLDNYRCNPSNSPLSTILTSSGEHHGHRLRILELGSGTGFVGIAAAAILGADVTVTDLGHVTPNLKFNVELNADMLASNNGIANVAELNWGHADHMEAIGKDYDVVLGSDVVYHNHLYEPLIDTLKYLLLRGEFKTVFLMAHLKRWKKESAFFKKAKKHFAVDVVHRDHPSEGKRVGVVVYRFLSKKWHAH